MLNSLKNLYKEKFDRIEAYWILVIYGAGMANMAVFTKMSVKEGFLFLGTSLIIGLILAWKAGERSK